MVKQRFSNRNQHGRVSTALPQQEWVALGQSLQRLLQQEWVKAQAFQVRCAVREGTLLVLAEHLLHVEPDPEEIFISLEATIRALLPGVITAGVVVPSELPVQLLLRISGYQQPYASRMFHYIAQSSPASINPFPSEQFAPPAKQIYSVQPSVPAVVIEPTVIESIAVEPTIETETPILSEQFYEPSQAVDAPEEINAPEITRQVELEIEQPTVTELETVLEAATPEATEIATEQIEITEPEIGELEIGEPENAEPKIDTHAAVVDESAEIDVAENTVVEPDADSFDIAPRWSDQNIDLNQSEILAHSVANDFVNTHSIEQIESEQTEVDQIKQIEPPGSDSLHEILESQTECESSAISVEAITAENIEETAKDEILTEGRLPNVVAETNTQIECRQSKNHSSNSSDELTEIEQRTNPSHQHFEPISRIDEPISEFRSELEYEHTTLSESHQIETLKSEACEAEHEVEAKTEAVNHFAPVVPTIHQTQADAEKREIPEPTRRFQWTPSNLGLVSAVGGFVLVSGMYVLTRPCVIGACEPLQQATQLSRAAIQTAQTTESALAIVEAHRQLSESSYLLATIPSWSRHYQSAQTLLNGYEDQAVVLGKVVKALEQANTAAQNSQNPPHPLPKWREIQWLWREVITQLEQIPSSSTLYPLVQRKLQEYRVNLTGINQRVGIEQQAQDRINAARQAGQLAEARAKAAQSAENWQETAATWTAAIGQLRQIPQSTMVYDEAQQLLAIYQPNLTEASNRQAQELVAAKAYTQAVDAAAQARTLEQQNQWSQAKAQWQSALTYARQVPTVTSYYSQVQPLIGTYAQMLQQASQNAQRSVAIQTSRLDLDQACPNAAKICTYTLSPEAIRVQFTSSYAQTVSLTLNNKQPTDNSRSAVLNQVNGSLRTLADISETTQVPIELYDAKGTKLGTYTPSLSGYVPQ
jgi:hypothetical protein